jgi:hypothetical protein
MIRHMNILYSTSVCESYVWRKVGRCRIEALLLHFKHCNSQLSYLQLLYTRIEAVQLAS